MTISSEKSDILHSGNGVTTSFAYDFLVQDADDLKVYLDDASQSSGYVVNNVGNEGGGTVVFDTAPDSGAVVYFDRVVPITQEVDYEPYDPFPAETHEAALDKLTMMVQQINTSNIRAVEYVPGSPSIGIPMPTLSSGLYLKVKEDGSGMEWANLRTVVEPGVIYSGYKQRSDLFYNDDTTIVIPAGIYEVAGKVVSIINNVTLGVANPSTLYSYIYISYDDIPTGGVLTQESNFLDSSFEPVYDKTKLGWYHPTRHSDRCIGAIRIKNGDIVPFSLFANRVHYLEAVQEFSGTLSYDTATVLTLDIPVFSQLAHIAARQAYSSTDSIVYYHYGDGVVGDQIITKVNANSQLSVNNFTMMVDPDREIKLFSVNGDDSTFELDVFGWSLPDSV